MVNWIICVGLKFLEAKQSFMILLTKMRQTARGGTGSMWSRSYSLCVSNIIKQYHHRQLHRKFAPVRTWSSLGSQIAQIRFRYLRRPRFPYTERRTPPPPPCGRTRARAAGLLLIGAYVPVSPSNTQKLKVPQNYNCQKQFEISYLLV